MAKKRNYEKRGAALGRELGRILGRLEREARRAARRAKPLAATAKKKSIGLMRQAAWALNKAALELEKAEKRGRKGRSKRAR